MNTFNASVSLLTGKSDAAETVAMDAGTDWPLKKVDCTGRRVAATWVVPAAWLGSAARDSRGAAERDRRRGGTAAAAAAGGRRDLSSKNRVRSVTMFRRQHASSSSQVVGDGRRSAVPPSTGVVVVVVASTTERHWVSGTSANLAVRLAAWWSVDVDELPSLDIICHSSSTIYVIANTRRPTRHNLTVE